MTRPQPRTEEKGFDPTALIIAQLEGGPYYQASQVVEITGVPYNTLKNWSKTGRIKAPSLEHWAGARKIHLYTDEDLREITKVRSTSRHTQKRETQ